jgi:N-glycosylase/DNA lyase
MKLDIKEQKYIIKNCKSFELKDIFECGQCFRWNKQEDGSYTGVFKRNVLNVKSKNNQIIISGICQEDIEKVCMDYFDLNRNYEEIKSKLSKVDNYMQESIKYGAGIRILNQDLWEMIISFIISANNNIPRIKKIIEKMSKEYGTEIEFRNQTYYTFPTTEQLSRANIQDLRKLGLGFRDKYIYETTKIIKERKIDLVELQEKDTTSARKELLTLAGVGPKVADCILLFSTLKRFDVFPIDVWVRRVMNDLYIHNEVEEKVSKKEIKKLAKEKFGDLEGIAQQYLFYWKRENN